MAEALRFVYALGRIELRFPQLSLEKEFAQVAGRSETAGLTARQVQHALLSKRENRYIARLACYVLTIEGLDQYILHPRDPLDFELLVEAIRPAPRPTDIDIVIGVKGPIAAPEVCNGLALPIVVFDQIYSFDIDSLIKSIPRPDTILPADFEAAAEELFTRTTQILDNSGEADEHRAANYVAVRYPAIYTTAAAALGQNSALAGVDVKSSRLSGPRKVVDVIFSFNNRQTDFVERHFVRVDVTEEFPFLVTKLSPYFER